MRYILIVLLLLIQCESKEERAYRKYKRKLEEQNRKHQELVREDSIANANESQKVAKLDSIKRAEEELIKFKKEEKYKFVNKWLVITGTENDSIKAVKNNRDVINTNYYTGLKNDLFVAVAYASENEKKAKQFGKDSLNGIEHYVKYSGDYINNGVQVDYKKIDFEEFKKMHEAFSNRWVGITKDSNSTSTVLLGYYFSNLDNNKKYFSAIKGGFSDTVELKEFIGKYKIDVDTLIFVGYLKNVSAIPNDIEEKNLQYWYQFNNNGALYFKSKIDTLREHYGEFYLYDCYNKSTQIDQYENQHISYYEEILTKSKKWLYVFNKNGSLVLGNTNQKLLLINNIGEILKEDIISYSRDDEGKFLGQELIVQDDKIKIIEYTYDSTETTIWYDGN